jgi:hypothetical protein
MSHSVYGVEGQCTKSMPAGLIGALIIRGDAILWVRSMMLQSGIIKVTPQVLSVFFVSVNNWSCTPTRSLQSCLLILTDAMSLIILLCKLDC